MTDHDVWLTEAEVIAASNKALLEEYRYVCSSMAAEGYHMLSMDELDEAEIVRDRIYKEILMRMS